MSLICVLNHLNLHLMYLNKHFKAISQLRQRIICEAWSRVNQIRRSLEINENVAASKAPAGTDGTSQATLMNLLSLILATTKMTNHKGIDCSILILKYVILHSIGNLWADLVNGQSKKDDTPPMTSYTHSTVDIVHHGIYSFTSILNWYP